MAWTRFRRYLLPLSLALMVICSCATHDYRAVIVDSDNNVIDSYPIEPLPEKEWAGALASDFLGAGVNPALYHPTLMESKFFLKLYPDSRYGRFVYQLGVWSAILASEYDPDLDELSFSFKRAYVRQGYIREAMDLLRRYGHLGETADPDKLMFLLERGFWDEEAFGSFCFLMRKTISVNPASAIFGYKPQASEASYFAEGYLKWSEDTGFRRFYDGLE